VGLSPSFSRVALTWTRTQTCSPDDCYAQKAQHPWHSAHIPEKSGNSKVGTRGLKESTQRCTILHYRVVGTTQSSTQYVSHLMWLLYVKNCTSNLPISKSSQAETNSSARRSQMGNKMREARTNLCSTPNSSSSTPCNHAKLPAPADESGWLALLVKHCVDDQWRFTMYDHFNMDNKAV